MPETSAPETILKDLLEAAYDDHRFELTRDALNAPNGSLDVGPVQTLLDKLIGLSEGKPETVLALHGVEVGVQKKKDDASSFFIVGTLATNLPFLPEASDKKAVATFTYDAKSKSVAVVVGIGFNKNEGEESSPSSYAFEIGASYASVKKKNKKVVKGHLRVDKNTFEAEFAKEKASKRVVLKWAKEEGDGKDDGKDDKELDLTELVAPFGLTPPTDPNSEFNLGLTSASVTYDVRKPSEKKDDPTGTDAPENGDGTSENGDGTSGREDDAPGDGEGAKKDEKESSREFVLTGTSKTYGSAVFIVSKINVETPTSSGEAQNGDSGSSGDENGGGKALQTVFTMLLGGGPDAVLSISNLPLVGAKLASLETMEVSKIRLMVTSQPISKEAAETINEIIKGAGKDDDSGKKDDEKKEANEKEKTQGDEKKGGKKEDNGKKEGSEKKDEDTSPTLPTLPKAGLKSKFGIGADLKFGDETIPLSIGFDKPKGKSDGSTTSSGDKTKSGKKKGGVKTTDAKDTDGTTWFHVQKKIGPVTFDKVGVRYENLALVVALNASLSLGGVDVSLDGLAMGTKMNDFKPYFDLDGLGIDYKKDPLDIGGALIHRKHPSDGVEWEYAGDAIVTVPDFSLSAIGAYAKLKGGSPSMFFFAELDAPLGGPSFFFITGLKGGFGYNSQLQIPEPKDVADFPLLKGFGKSTPMEALKKLEEGKTPAVRPRAGETWLAAGINFTTEELVDSKALLVVEFGKDLVISLLGLSDALFPKSGAEKGKYARIELGLEAVIKPNDGVFLVAAELTKNSYVLDPAAHLTGGFAFEVWFGENPHAGDFVITLGGYNKHFDAPEWYPREPRLGLKWAINKNVGITGESYFALTPSALMAGGRLDVEFHSGNLRAWLKAYADLLIRWKPFYFEAGVGVNVGVSYKMNLLFTSVTLRVSLGAELKLHGPPTGGSATVHWWVISFTIPFGAERGTGETGHLKWEGFRSLIASEETTSAVQADALDAGTEGGVEVLSIAATKGRMQRRYSGDGAPPKDVPWAVRGHNFTFTAVSKIPASTVTSRSVKEDGTPVGESPSPIHIRPMGLENVDSTLTVEVKLDDKSHSGWRAMGLHRNVPKALWGEAQSPTGAPPLESGSKQLVPGALVGVSMQAPAAETGASPGPIDVKAALGYDAPNDPGAQPLPNDTSGLPAPQDTGDVVGRISKINDETTRSRRDALAGALGYASGDLTRLAAQAGHLYADEPMVLPDDPPADPPGDLTEDPPSDPS